MTDDTTDAPQTITATLEASPTAVLLLQALDRAGLLSRIAGAKATLNHAPTLSDAQLAAIPADARRLAALIVELGAGDDARRAAAVDGLVELAAEQPQWHASISQLLYLTERVMEPPPDALISAPRRSLH